MLEVQLDRCLVLGTCSQVRCLVSSHCYRSAWVSSRFSVRSTMLQRCPPYPGASQMPIGACAQATVLSSQLSLIGAREKADLMAPFLPPAALLHKLGQTVFLLRASSKPSRNQFNVTHLTLFLRLLWHLDKESSHTSNTQTGHFHLKSQHMSGVTVQTMSFSSHPAPERRLVQ